MKEVKNSGNSFKGTLGFIMAAAGSAVGLGNIWRFPYLAAKDGGGIFLLVYIVLALTFGFTLLTSDIAIGRKTQQSPMKAYDSVKKGWGPLGIIASCVAPIIFPYYCAIGGWIIKYFIVFLTGQGVAAAGDGFFGGFIGDVASPIVYMIIFMAIVAVIVSLGVKKGIETSSKVLMPILILLVLFIAVYSLTVKDSESGRTGLDGLAIYLIPNFEGMTFGKFLTVCVDAMGQLFFSLSVAMGIMVTYGSYVNDDANLLKSINQIEIFDTAIAFLAGVMIIPAVYAFMGPQGLEMSGPGLMFVALPKVFASMGVMGQIVGCVFFLMVLFAAVTSAVSILETIVANLELQFKLPRIKATLAEFGVGLVLAVFVCLGYNVLSFIRIPNVGDILDTMDFISNKVLMPVVAIGTCVLIGWIVKPDYIISELEKGGKKFKRRKKLYEVMIKYVAPILLTILFITAFIPSA